MGFLFDASQKPILFTAEDAESAENGKFDIGVEFRIAMVLLCVLCALCGATSLSLLFGSDQERNSFTTEDAESAENGKFNIGVEFRIAMVLLCVLCGAICPSLLFGSDQERNSFTTEDTESAENGKFHIGVESRIAMVLLCVLCALCGAMRLSRIFILAASRPTSSAAA